MSIIDESIKKRTIISNKNNIHIFLYYTIILTKIIYLVRIFTGITWQQALTSIELIANENNFTLQKNSIELHNNINKVILSKNGG
ncbi:hypothetical protein CK238_13280 [Bacillus velezensis]|nr:hypothetical protein CK238_13280 [Bacillus velezensis]